MSGATEGVALVRGFDLVDHYGPMLADEGIRLRRPEEIADPAAIRFALCWDPAPEAFDAFTGLQVIMAPGAGVDGLLAHPKLPETAHLLRVRDPFQGQQMAGFVAHEVLHRVRDFEGLAKDAQARAWNAVPVPAPAETVIAVLGHGTMGRAVVETLAGLGFSLRVACRSTPDQPIDGVTYCTGDGAAQEAASGAAFVVNVLPLTAQTENVLNAALFDRMARGAWLIQIGRGEHLVEGDLQSALDSGQLAGASLDVFRTEPLPRDHPFWGDPRLRITPHIASIAQPQVLAQQAAQSLAELDAGHLPSLRIDRARGY